MDELDDSFFQLKKGQQSTGSNDIFGIYDILQVKKSPIFFGVALNNLFKPKLPTADDELLQRLDNESARFDQLSRNPPEEIIELQQVKKI